MMGVYGMLAPRPGAVLPALPDPGRALARALGAHLVLVDRTSGWPGWCFATLLPLGIIQLYKSVNSRIFRSARGAKFFTNDTNALLEWLRLPGDLLFIIGGAVPTLYIAWIGIRHTVNRVTLDEPEGGILFTDIMLPPSATGAGGDEATAARLI